MATYEEEITKKRLAGGRKTIFRTIIASERKKPTGTSKVRFTWYILVLLETILKLKKKIGFLIGRNEVVPSASKWVWKGVNPDLVK